MTGPAQKEANKLVAHERAANEHGFADLENWRVLTKLRLGARHATAPLPALLVLTRAEVSRRQTAMTDNEPSTAAHTSLRTRNVQVEKISMTQRN